MTFVSRKRQERQIVVVFCVRVAASARTASTLRTWTAKNTSR